MNLEFPPLFVNADQASQILQKKHFRLLQSQYVLLLAASSTTVLGHFWLGARSEALLYLIFVILAVVALVRSVSSKPEKGWYNARAIAESVKTTTWRYAMGAEPFELTSKTSAANQLFAKRLEAIKSGHDPQGDALRFGIQSGDIITPTMQSMRALEFKSRKNIYLDQRIEDQFGWYQNKSKVNDRKSVLLSWICIGLYGFAVLIGLMQVLDPTMQLFGISNSLKWVSEPVLVAAAGLLGWMQAKRYAELAASYNLAAHDIMSVKASIQVITTESAFAHAVAEAESAFSREHTQWVARQSQS